MERVKKPVCIVLFLCSAVLACKGENPFHEDWRENRFGRARLTGVKWKLKGRPVLSTSCDEAPDSRDEALNLLVVADGDCLDKAVRAVGRYAKEDLAAAYLMRFERKHDPVDLLRALETAEGFNRALALEWLGLNREAIHSWDEVVGEGSDWSSEAARNRDALQRLPDPLREWNPEALADALERRDAAALSRMVRAFPADAAQAFEKSDLRDRGGSRLFAMALAAAGEHYPLAVVNAMDRTRDPKALERGLAAFKNKDYSRAATFLERAGNPLHLAARYYVAVTDDTISPLDAAIPHLKPEYRELVSRIHSYRANILEWDNRYLEAYADYDHALAFAKGEPTATARVLSRRSLNYAVIGDAGVAFREAHCAVSLLGRVADTNTRNTAYGAAAIAARRLGYPVVALHYQNAAVEDVQRSVNAATADTMAGAKEELVVALRARAEIHVELGRNDDAEGDLTQAAALAEAVEVPGYRDLFRMRILEVRAQALLKTDPAKAVATFSEAMQLAAEQDSTYQAMLHFKRAAARRSAGDPQADDDLAEAMNILRDEVRSALAANPEAVSKPLWDPYFSRFQEMYHDLIESRIAARDVEGAFFYAELARAFEPMQILLLSGSLPPGFGRIEKVKDLRAARASLPEDTVILQYLVLRERTFTWVVTRERILLVSQRATKDQVERWVEGVEAGVASRQPDRIVTTMRAVYAELFREPLKQAGPSKTRIVIVPDQPMLGLPFNALAGSRSDEGYLIERGSIATSGSTSLYLYALAHDGQLSAEHDPRVLLISAPAFDLKRFPALPYAIEEVEELAGDFYPRAEMLTGSEATPRRFLSKAREAGIIHFAGHALASPEMPWRSRLVLAPHGQESGELTAETLMKELPVLAHTRLVVLGACETAGGAFVGPQGLAPLVRPFIGAGVPAVVGTLWNVRDASTKQLLVSLHCHYRHGDDVAVALRKAQLERLRESDTDHAMNWAAFQVVGYAASPYPPSIAQENPNSVAHLCTQNSLHRPDGLHPQ
jgi:CHAT domain-containing protein/tetratricopeptide (TPR) repeat protein